MMPLDPENGQSRRFLFKMGGVRIDIFFSVDLLKMLFFGWLVEVC